MPAQTENGELDVGRAIALHEVETGEITLRLRGISPLLQNRRIPDDVKDKDMSPEEEAALKVWELADPKDGCRYGHPATAFKAAIIASERTQDAKGMKKLAQSFQIIAQDPSGCIPLITPGWVLDQRYVRIQRDQVLWPRPRFDDWQVDLVIVYDKEAISAQELVDKIMRAGIFVGVGSYRPEKQAGFGGTFGMFEVVAEE